MVHAASGKQILAALNIAQAAGECRIRVKLAPKAAKNAVGEVMQGADGLPMLKASVTAPPEDGKANEALIALLAAHWGLPKSAIQLLQGATSRLKTLRIEGGLP